MGLIYVNPEGPNGKPDPLAAARDIRETFARMAMNDEETVALIAGGHTFGKATAPAMPAHVGPNPKARAFRGAGPRLDSDFGSGKGVRHHHQRHRGRLDAEPDKWDNSYFDTLFGYEWELTKSPAGAWQWTPKDGPPDQRARRPRSGSAHAPMMTTTDMALRMDPAYEPISRRFHENPDEFADAFARAWFKLTHRDMGPKSRYLGARSRRGSDLAGPDPGGRPRADRRRRHRRRSRPSILASGLSISELVSTAWASASTFRGSDKRGGANGARIRLAPQKDWEVNQPAAARG